MISCWEQRIRLRCVAPGLAAGGHPSVAEYHGLLTRSGTQVGGAVSVSDSAVATRCTQRLRRSQHRDWLLSAPSAAWPNLRPATEV